MKRLKNRLRLEGSRRLAHSGGMDGSRWNICFDLWFVVGELEGLESWREATNFGKAFEVRGLAGGCPVTLWRGRWLDIVQ